MADLTSRSQRRPVKSRDQEKHTYEKSTKEDTITLDLSTTAATLPNDNSHKREKERFKRVDTNSVIGTGILSESANTTAEQAQFTKYQRNTFTAPQTSSHSRRSHVNHNKEHTANQQPKRPQTVSEGNATSTKWRVKQHITNSNSELFARTSFSIVNMMDKMQLGISEIEREIKEEQTALEQYKNQMVYLVKRKEELEKKVESDVEWLKDAELNITTFNTSYSSLFSELGALKIKT
jgi:hypothetical protein